MSLRRDCCDECNNILPSGISTTYNQDPCAEMQCSADWNVVTAPTTDGGFCVKFNKNPTKQRTTTVSGRTITSPPNSVPTTSKGYQSPTAEFMASAIKNCEDMDFYPSTSRGVPKHSSKRGKKQRYADTDFETRNSPAAEAARALLQLSDKITEQVENKQTAGKGLSSNLELCLADVENAVRTAAAAVTEEQGKQGKRLRAINCDYESGREADQPAMLVCVLQGPSLELMKISNTVDKMSKRSGIQIRMNAPIH